MPTVAFKRVPAGRQGSTAAGFCSPHTGPSLAPCQTPPATLLSSPPASSPSPWRRSPPLLWAWLAPSPWGFGLGRGGVTPFGSSSTSASSSTSRNMLRTMAPTSPLARRRGLRQPRHSWLRYKTLSMGMLRRPCEPPARLPFVAGLFYGGLSPCGGHSN